MAGTGPRRALPEEPGHLLAEVGDLPTREDIASSWHRSMAYGVSRDKPDIRIDTALESPERLERVVRPAADRLSDDLAGTGVSLLLTDEQARVTDRIVPDHDLLATLDQIPLAPGVRCSEDLVGTSAISVALHHNDAALVTGREHYARRLTAMACAAAPITDPATGRLLGTVAIACPIKSANTLMIPYIKRVCRSIEQRLIEGASAADRILLEHFLRARRRAKGPIVCVNDRTMLTNTAAATLVQPADRMLLWEWASQALASRRPTGTIRLCGGPPVTIHAQHVNESGTVAGALLRLDAPQPPAPGPGPGPGPDSRPAFGWDSMTGTERSVAAVIAEGATNREAGARLFLSPHTIDFHLRQIYRKLDIASRVELARLVMQHQQADPGLHPR
jgi:DNA-binding CsgD family transcriptional regulator